MRTCVSAAVAIAIGSSVCGGASAQQLPASATVAVLVHAEGDVYLDDRVVAAKASPARLGGAAHVRTNQGRAVISLERAGLLFLDAGTSVRLPGAGSRLEVLTGSAAIASVNGAPPVTCESDLKLSDAGWFRFDVQPVDAYGARPCRLRVFEGTAAVPLATMTNHLRTGQMMMCDRRCGDMIPTRDFSSDQLDDFDRWARRMHQQFRQ